MQTRLGALRCKLWGALGAAGAHAGAGHPPASPLGALTTTHLAVLLLVGAQGQHFPAAPRARSWRFLQKNPAQMPQRCAEGWIPMNPG